MWLDYTKLPSTIKWLDQFITEDFPKNLDNKPISAKVLHENYKGFRHNQEKSLVQFGKAIKTLIDKEGLVGIEKGTRSNTGIQYTINQDQVHGWLKSKGYTLSD
jgi:hypothetical protein